MGERTARFDAENQRRASAESVVRKAEAQTEAALPTTASPRSMAQRRLADLANRGAQVQSTAHYQAMLNGETGASAQPMVSSERVEALEDRIVAAPNRTGLPDALKAAVESLSGVSLQNVRVHYNSGKPGQLQAHAYTQGSEIHVAPGQEKHLPHEAWHAAQQAQGRVPVTAQLEGVRLNDDAGLEHEADAMGARAASMRGTGT
jgi:hypothetical protein